MTSALSTICIQNVECVKGGLNLNAIFLPLDTALMEISRSRFKQSKNSTLIPLIYVVGCFVNFWVYLGGDSFSISQGFVKLREMRNIEA